MKYANNVFFEGKVADEIHRALTRRPDIVHANRKGVKGKALLSASDEEIRAIAIKYRWAPETQVLGDDDISLDGTSIILRAMVIAPL